MTRATKIDAAPESIILRSAYASDADFKRAIIAALVAGRVVRSAPDIGTVSLADPRLTQPGGIEVFPAVGGYRWVQEAEDRFGFYRLEKV